MQRITVHQLSAIFLVAVLSQFAAVTASAAGNRRLAGRTAKRSAHHRAKRSTPTGGVFGGVTSAGWPVVIQVSSDGREVVRATMGLPMRCQPSGGEFDVADFYTGIPISTLRCVGESATDSGCEVSRAVDSASRACGSW
jgi:hypothetical protein